MAGDNEKYNDAADEACIAKEQRDKDRREAKYESLEANFKKGFADMMRHPGVKKSLALEAREATRAADGRWRGRSMEELMEIAGAHLGNEGRKVTDEEALHRPWEE